MTEWKLVTHCCNPDCDRVLGLMTEVMSKKHNTRPVTVAYCSHHCRDETEGGE